jgi:hypothetical protein
MAWPWFISSYFVVAICVEIMAVDVSAKFRNWHLPINDKICRFV